MPAMKHLIKPRTDASLAGFEHHLVSRRISCHKKEVTRASPAQKLAKLAGVCGLLPNSLVSEVQGRVAIAMEFGELPATKGEPLIAISAPEVESIT